jgi:hypothetical protein
MATATVPAGSSARAGVAATSHPVPSVKQINSRNTAPRIISPTAVTLGQGRYAGAHSPKVFRGRTTWGSSRITNPGRCPAGVHHYRRPLRRRWRHLHVDGVHRLLRHCRDTLRLNRGPPIRCHRCVRSICRRPDTDRGRVRTVGLTPA